MPEQFEPGDRVRGMWDLGTVLDVLDDGGRILVQFDAVDATGWRVASYFRQPVPRLPRTLTKVPKDTPMVEENEASRAARRDALSEDRVGESPPMGLIAIDPGSVSDEQVAEWNATWADALRKPQTIRLLPGHAAPVEFTTDEHGQPQPHWPDHG